LYFKNWRNEPHSIFTIKIIIFIILKKRVLKINKIYLLNKYKN